MATPLSADDLKKLADALKDAKPEIKDADTLKRAAAGIMSGGKQ
jgi:hypothetical protein